MVWVRFRLNHPHWLIAFIYFLVFRRDRSSYSSGHASDSSIPDSPGFRGRSRSLKRAKSSEYMVLGKISLLLLNAYYDFRPSLLRPLAFETEGAIWKLDKIANFILMVLEKNRATLRELLLKSLRFHDNVSNVWCTDSKLKITLQELYY